MAFSEEILLLGVADFLLILDGFAFVETVEIDCFDGYSVITTGLILSV